MQAQVLPALQCAQLTVRRALHAVQPLARVLQVVSVCLPQQISVSQVPQLEHLQAAPEGQQRQRRVVREHPHWWQCASAREYACLLLGSERIGRPGCRNAASCRSAS